MKDTWIKYITGFVVLLLIFFYWQSCQDNIILSKINRQNEIAYGDTLKLVQGENLELYHKYVSVLNLDSVKNELLKKKDEKILLLTVQNIKLVDLVSNNTGIRIDTIEINKDCYGIKLRFENDGVFYSYIDSVYVEKVPWHSLRVKFKPFDVTNFVTRNNETGVWSSFIEVPKELKKYILIGNITTKVDKAAFGFVEGEIDRFRLSITPLLGQGFINSKSYLLGSILGKINNKHSILLSKGIGNDFIGISYGWNFDIK